MNVYLETSALVQRIVVRQPALKEWGQWGQAFTSDLTRVEALRTLDRYRLEGAFDDVEISAKRAELKFILSAAERMAVTAEVLEKASQSYPTVIGALDAIHLATALLKEDEIEGELVFLTHDRQLGIAARALGFDVRGVANL